MRIWVLVVLFAIAGGISVARADVFTSATASVPVMTPCSSSGPAQSSCSSFGPDSSGAISMANGNQFGGSVYALAYGGPPDTPGHPVGAAQVEINGEYVLVGGTGMASFDLNYDPNSLQGAILECSVMIDGGTAQECDSPVIVEYEVPFTMDVDLSVFAESGPLGEGVEGRLSVDFAQSGLFTTPEPSSILLLLPGLGGVLFAARSRVRGR